MARRVTQAEADYGRGDPITNCGNCAFYLGRDQCSKVMGKVAGGYGLSNQYQRKNNPFGKTLAPHEVQTIKAMAADARDRSGG